MTYILLNQERGDNPRKSCREPHPRGSIPASSCACTLANWLQCRRQWGCSLLLLQAKSRPFERERRYGDLSNLRRSPIEVGLISGDGINLECSRLILLPFSAQSSIEITPDTDDM